jgi:hypothetical protein
MEETAAKCFIFVERKISLLKICYTIKDTIKTTRFNTKYKLFCKAYLCFPYSFQVEGISLQHVPISLSTGKDLQLLSDTGLTVMYNANKSKD